MLNPSDALAATADGGVDAGAPDDAPAPEAVAARSRRKISKLIRVLRCNRCTKEYRQEALDGEEFDGDDEFCSVVCRAAFKDVDGEPAAAPKWGGHEVRRAAHDRVRYWSTRHPHVKFFAGAVVPGEKDSPNYVAFSCSPDFPGEAALRSMVVTTLMDNDVHASFDSLLGALPSSEQPTSGRHNKRLAVAGVEHGVPSVGCMVGLRGGLTVMPDNQFSVFFNTFSQTSGDVPDRPLAGAASLAALAQAAGTTAGEERRIIDISGQYDSDEEGGGGTRPAVANANAADANPLAAAAPVAHRTRAGAATEAAAADAAAAAADAAAVAAAVAMPTTAAVTGGVAAVATAPVPNLLAAGGALPPPLPAPVPDGVTALYTQVGPLVARSRERAAAWQAAVMEYRAMPAVAAAVGAAAAAAQATATSEAAGLAAWMRDQQDADGVALSSAEVVGKGQQLLLEHTRSCDLATTPSITALRTQAGQLGSSGGGDVRVAAAALAAVAALEAAVLAVRAAAPVEGAAAAPAAATAAVLAGAAADKAVATVSEMLSTVGIVVPPELPGLYTDVLRLQRDLAATALCAVLLHSQPLGPVVSAAAMLLFASQRLLAFVRLLGGSGSAGGTSRSRAVPLVSPLPPLSAAASAIVESPKQGTRKIIENAASRCELTYGDFMSRFVRELELSLRTYSPLAHNPQPWEGVDASLALLLPHIEAQHGSACWLHCFNAVLGRPLGGTATAALFVLLSQVVDEEGVYLLNWSVGRLSSKWAPVLEEWHMRPPVSVGMQLGSLRRVSLLLNDRDAAVSVVDGGASLLQQPFLGFGTFPPSTLVAGGGGTTSLLPLLHAASTELVRKFVVQHTGSGGKKDGITITPADVTTTINQLIVYYSDGHRWGHFINLQRLSILPGSPQRWLYIDSLAGVRTRVFSEGALPKELPIFRKADRAFLAFTLPVDVAARRGAHVTLCEHVNDVLDTLGLGSLGTLQPPPAAVPAPAQQVGVPAAVADAALVRLRQPATTHTQATVATSEGGEGAPGHGGRRVRMRVGE